MTEILHILHWLGIAGFAGEELPGFPVCDNLYAEYHRKTAEKPVGENFDKGQQKVAGRDPSAESNFQLMKVKMLGMEEENTEVGTLSLLNFLCLLWYCKEIY